MQRVTNVLLSFPAWQEFVKLLDVLHLKLKWQRAPDELAKQVLLLKAFSAE